MKTTTILALVCAVITVQAQWSRNHDSRDRSDDRRPSNRERNNNGWSNRNNNRNSWDRSDNRRSNERNNRDRSDNGRNNNDRSDDRWSNNNRNTWDRSDNHRSHSWSNNNNRNRWGRSDEPNNRWNGHHDHFNPRDRNNRNSWDRSDDHRSHTWSNNRNNWDHSGNQQSNGRWNNNHDRSDDRHNHHSWGQSGDRHSNDRWDNSHDRSDDRHNHHSGDRSDNRSQRVNNDRWKNLGDDAPWSRRESTRTTRYNNNRDYYSRCKIANNENNGRDVGNAFGGGLLGFGSRMNRNGYYNHPLNRVEAQQIFNTKCRTAYGNRENYCKRKIDRTCDGRNLDNADRCLCHAFDVLY